MPFSELPRIDVINCAVLCATGHEGSLFPWLCATPFRKGRERAIEDSIFVAQCSTVRRCRPQGMPSRPPTPHCHVVVEPGPHCASRLSLVAWPGCGAGAVFGAVAAAARRQSPPPPPTTCKKVVGFQSRGVCGRQGFRTGEHWTKTKGGWKGGEGREERKKKTWASGPGLGYRLRHGRFLRPKRHAS